MHNELEVHAPANSLRLMMRIIGPMAGVISVVIIGWLAYVAG